MTLAGPGAREEPTCRPAARRLSAVPATSRAEQNGTPVCRRAASDFTRRRPPFCHGDGCPSSGPGKPSVENRGRVGVAVAIAAQSVVRMTALDGFPRQRGTAGTRRNRQFLNRLRNSAANRKNWHNTCIPSSRARAGRPRGRGWSHDRVAGPARVGSHLDGLCVPLLPPPAAPFGSLLGLIALSVAGMPRACCLAKRIPP